MKLPIVEPMIVVVIMRPFADIINIVQDPRFFAELFAECKKPPYGDGIAEGYSQKTCTEGEYSFISRDSPEPSKQARI